MEVASLRCNVTLIGLLIWFCGVASRRGRLGAVLPSRSISGGSVYCAHLFAFNLSAAGQSAKRGAGIWLVIFHMTPKQCVHLPDRRPGRDQHLAESYLRRSFPPSSHLSFFPLWGMILFSLFWRLWRDEVMCLLHGWMNLRVLSIFSSAELPGFAFLSREGHCFLFKQCEWF